MWAPRRSEHLPRAPGSSGNEISLAGVGDFGVRGSIANVGGLGFEVSLADVCTIEAESSLVGYRDLVLRPSTLPLLLKRVQVFVRVTLGIEASIAVTH